MSNLIYQINTYRVRARTIFKSTLKIYDDYIVFRKRKWFTVTEITITYNHIAQANLIKGVFFSELQIINSGGSENAVIKYVLNKPAVKAKKILDQKIYRYQATGGDKRKYEAKPHAVDTFEKSLARLHELVNKGKISEREFEKKKRELIKSLG